jgi:hypothetical protein
MYERYRVGDIRVKGEDGDLYYFGHNRVSGQVG